MSLLLALGGAPPATYPIAAFEFDDEVVLRMRKNTASQNIEGQINDRTTGAPLTTSVSIFVTGDNGTQTAGGGTLSHKGNGAWNYIPTQAETNYNHIAFTFVHASGVVKTYNVYTYSYDPHNIASLGLTNLDAAISTRMATYTQPTGFLAAAFPATIASPTNITSVGSVTGLTAANLDVAVSTRLASAGYTAPDNATIGLIAGYTDSIESRLPAALVNGRMASNSEQIGGQNVTASAPITMYEAIGTNSTAQAALEDQFDGTGLIGGSYPATQEQISEITLSSSAISKLAISYTLITGTESSGTYQNTWPLDGIFHSHTDSSGSMELYYEFNIGEDGLPVSVTMSGYLSGSNDALGVYAWDWTLSAWTQIGTRYGAGGTTVTTNTHALFQKYVGTGANVGKVRIRYYGTGLTTATLNVDQIYISYSVVPITEQTKGTVVDASPAANGFNTNLTNQDGTWNDALLFFTSGVLQGQTSPIAGYYNTNGRVEFVSGDTFTEAPANGDSFVIKYGHVHPVSQIADYVTNTPLIEAYAADGASPTLSQALFQLLGRNYEFEIAGDVLTVKKLDGVTTAMTFTLSPPGGPYSSITRSS